MNRRFLLGGLLVAVLAVTAGCSSAGSIEMQPVNDSALADRASRSAAPVEHPFDGTVPRPRAIAYDAITNGSTTVEARAPPLDPGLPYALDGAYYNLSYQLRATHTRTEVSLAIDYNTTDTTGDTIQYAALPPADQALLDALLPQRQPADSSDGPDLAVARAYTDAELEASVLAPTQQYDLVSYNGSTYRIFLDGIDEIEVHVYEYRATEIAASTQAYAAHLRTQYAFTITDLPQAQRSILDSAVEEGSYYADSADDAAFDALVDRFRTHAAITETSTSGLWLVRYNDELYVADLRFGGFVDQ